MSFSKEWDTAYENGQRKPVGMSGILHSLFVNFIGDLKGQKILELGCGNACNAPHIVNSGATYCGVDGSQSIIESLSGLELACCDFTIDQPFGDDFDIVFDRAAVSHNTNQGVRSAIQVAYKALKRGGIYIGADWFSVNHSEFSRGEIVDSNTRTNYHDGQFIGIGNVHFSSEDELCEIFRQWERKHLIERSARWPQPGAFIHQKSRRPLVSSTYDGREYVSAVWDVVCRKPL